MQYFKLGAVATAASVSLFASGCGETQGDQIMLAGEIETFASGTPQRTGKFLHLSDIHFDVFANSQMNELATKPVDQWAQYFDANVAPSSGRFSDTNFALLISALTAAKDAGPYDFILYTGDYLPHGFSYGADESESAEFAAKIVEFVNLEIAKKMPNTPIVGMLGNNDGGCGDYTLHPDGDFLADLAPDMPSLGNGIDAEKDFKAHGFYTIPHPTVKGTDFVVLSTFWSHNFPGYEHRFSTRCNLIPSSENPGQDQVDFLNKKLGVPSGPTPTPTPSGSGIPSPNNVILLMHIPPGIDGFGGNHQWHTRYDDPFKDAVTRASKKVLGAFAGHTHMNEFRVFSDRSGPYLNVRIAPSVTTFNGNFPAFTVADYDLSNGAMTDYEVYSYRTDKATQKNAWQSEYRFTTSYKAGPFGNASLAKIAASLQDNSDPLTVRDAYRKFYSSKDSTGATCSWHNIVCATTAQHKRDFDSCVARQSPAYPQHCRK